MNVARAMTMVLVLRFCEVRFVRAVSLILPAHVAVPAQASLIVARPLR